MDQQNWIITPSSLGRDYLLTMYLSINIPIFKKVIHLLKFTIPFKSDQELVFIKDIISNFKSLDTSNIDNSEKLEQLINQLRSIIEQSWTKNAKKSRITKHSKQ